MKIKDGGAFLGTSWIDIICKSQLQSWVKDGRLGFSSLWGDEHDVFPSLCKWFPWEYWSKLTTFLHIGTNIWAVLPGPDDAMHKVPKTRLIEKGNGSILEPSTSLHEAESMAALGLPRWDDCHLWGKRYHELHRLQNLDSPEGKDDTAPRSCVSVYWGLLIQACVRC